MLGNLSTFSSQMTSTPLTIKVQIFFVIRVQRQLSFLPPFDENSRLEMQPGSAPPAPYIRVGLPLPLIPMASTAL